MTKNTSKDYELYLEENGMKFKALFCVGETTVSLAFYRYNPFIPKWSLIAGFERPYLLLPDNPAGYWLLDKPIAVAQWDLLRQNGWQKEQS